MHFNPIYENDVLKFNTPLSESFSPYDYNGGTVVAIAGADYAVIASDTRLSSERIIYTREQSKLFQLSEKSIIGFSGCWCDVLTFTRLLESHLQHYRLQNNKIMSTIAIAQATSTMLYYKRFFPFSMQTVLAGLDSDGTGCVFGYDPLGHYERCNSQSLGSGGRFIRPFFDNWISSESRSCAHIASMELDDAITIIKDAYISVAERDIYTGDNVEIKIITQEGINGDTFKLRKD
ncbi:hypothetical protein RI129_007443 [Pyrocoelia pectoralis]|uniref:Proteasome subunit beta n=1 Tax=Pyrocoelia pectoralis TaxID=417401 RepID=A0AAN7ZLF1_9COLE